jgi:hypothetical protein
LYVASGVGGRGYAFGQQFLEAVVDGRDEAGTFWPPRCLMPMIDTFTLLSVVAIFLTGATAGAWLNSLANGEYRSPKAHTRLRD